MQAPTLKIHQATLIYDDQILFDRLSFTIPGGKWTCLLGQSGIGKTSLLRIVANLSSEVVLAKPIETSDQLSLRNRISYVAQQDQLLPWLTILENVCLGYKLRGEKVNAKELYDRAEQLLQLVGLKNASCLYPRALSGGMKQRVLLARTLIEDKAIVLLDEPFASLDAITRYDIQDLAAELLADRTVILVTHDPIEALRLADQILIMTGRPAQLGSPIILNESAPRDPLNSEVLYWQSEVLQKLKA